MKGPAVLLQGKGIFEATKEQVPDLTSTSERGDLLNRESLQCNVAEMMQSAFYPKMVPSRFTCFLLFHQHFTLKLNLWRYHLMLMSSNKSRLKSNNISHAYVPSQQMLIYNLRVVHKSLSARVFFGNPGRVRCDRRKKTGSRRRIIN